MRNRRYPIGWFVLLALLWSNAGGVAAQQGAGAASWSADELAGKKLFLQRCSFCHLPQRPLPRETIGPSLVGLFQRGSVTETEPRVREMILQGRRGGPGVGMPGFQYGLEPSEIDKIIAYLKTLKK